MKKIIAMIMHLAVVLTVSMLLIFCPIFIGYCIGSDEHLATISCLVTYAVSCAVTATEFLCIVSFLLQKPHLEEDSSDES